MVTLRVYIKIYVREPKRLTTSFMTQIKASTMSQPTVTTATTTSLGSAAASSAQIRDADAGGWHAIPGAPKGIFFSLEGVSLALTRDVADPCATPPPPSPATSDHGNDDANEASEADAHGPPWTDCKFAARGLCSVAVLYIF